MPQRLTFDNGSTITWGYRQDGLKYSSNERAKRLSVITTVNAAGDTITRTRVSYDSHTQRYIGDFVRIGNNRWRVYHESGHADILTSASGDSTVYRYYVRDYLGSTRAVLAEDGTLLQDANYYPGGLSFSQLNDTEETDRLHCGKEWVDMEGLGWYDNTARFHDAILCRFTTPDPLAEQYPDLSPYAHCANNPLTIVDPTGMFQISNQDAEISPKLDHYLRYGIQAVLENEKVMAGLMKYGEFTREQIEADFKYGEGPMINFDPYIETYGEFKPNTNSNTLSISIELPISLENATGLEREALLFVTAVTILHEYVHYGDDQDGVDQHGEEGNNFEIDTYGKFVDMKSAREMIKNYIEQENNEQEN